jgi:addiction module HigA family antidote
MPMKNPPHPGGFVLRQCIEPLGLSITDAAAALGVTRTTLSELVNEKRGISPEMAVRLSKVFGGSAESVSVRGTASGAACPSGGEVEACWHQEGSIAGTGTGRKRIS